MIKASAPIKTGYTLISKKNFLFPDSFGSNKEVLATNGDGQLYWLEIPKYNAGFGLNLKDNLLSIDLTSLIQAIPFPEQIKYIGTDHQIIVVDNKISTPQNLDKDSTVQFKTLVVDEILLGGTLVKIPEIPKPVKYMPGSFVDIIDDVISVDMATIQSAIKFPDSLDVVGGKYVQVNKSNDTFIVDLIDPPFRLQSNIVVSRLSLKNQTESITPILYRVLEDGMYRVDFVVESPEEEEVAICWTNSEGKLSSSNTAKTFMCSKNTNITAALYRSYYSSYNIHFVVTKI